jgi:acetylornithine deacetylase
MLILAAGEENSDPAGITSVFASLSGDNLCHLWANQPGYRLPLQKEVLLVLDGYVQGRSGHAARNDGINALYGALDDIAALRDYSFAENSAIMGKIHLQVTQIQAVHSTTSFRENALCSGHTYHRRLQQ